VFMKYVKKKLVKKLQGENISSSVAKKYLDIYKQVLRHEQAGSRQSVTPKRAEADTTVALG